MRNRENLKNISNNKAGKIFLFFILHVQDYVLDH